MLKRAQKTFSPKPESLEFGRMTKVADSAADRQKNRCQMLFFCCGLAFIIGLMIGRLVW